MVTAASAADSEPTQSRHQSRSGLDIHRRSDLHYESDNLKPAAERAVQRDCVGEPQS